MTGILGRRRRVDRIGEGREEGGREDEREGRSGRKKKGRMGCGESVHSYAYNNNTHAPPPPLLYKKNCYCEYGPATSATSKMERRLMGKVCYGSGKDGAELFCLVTVFVDSKEGRGRRRLWTTFGATVFWQSYRPHPTHTHAYYPKHAAAFEIRLTARCCPIFI